MKWQMDWYAEGENHTYRIEKDKLLISKGEKLVWTYKDDLMMHHEVAEAFESEPENLRTKDRIQSAVLKAYGAV
jgi:hypothetical protein